MKLWPAILVTTLFFWMLQLACFCAIFTTWFIHFSVQNFVAFGAAKPETSLQTFLTHVMKFLTYPIRLFLPDGQFGDSSFTTILLLGANSLIWGIVLGLLFYALFKRTREKGAGAP